MIKRYLLTTTAIFMMAAMLLCGCKKEEEPEEPKEEEVVLVIEEEEEEVVEEEPKAINPITGEEVEDDELPARPLIVSIDNVGSAIPQSWLSKTDIVYEFPVEGKQTRLQAIFYSEFPEEFGPIRSTRPYFVDLTREYKGIFLAHGWSPDAKKYLKSGVVPYINAMDTDCKFYRVSDKSAPHNSYIKWSEVKGEIKEEGWWKEKQEVEPFTFLAEDEKNKGEKVTYIEFDSASHSEFTYNEKNNNYVRTINDGKDYIDKETGKSIQVKNVLVQKVSSKVLDSKGRLSIDMCAGGEAVLFTNGVMVEGTWSRENLDSRTIFKDKDGNEFKMSVGNTWVMLTDQNTTMNYSGPEAE